MFYKTLLFTGTGPEIITPQAEQLPPIVHGRYILKWFWLILKPLCILKRQQKKKISKFITVFNVWMHGEATQLLHHNTYSQVCLSSPGCKSWSVTGLKDVGPQIDSAVTCHNTRLCETHLLPQGVCSVASLCLWKQWHNSVKTFTWLSHTEGFSPDNSFCAVHHLIKSKALWNDSGRAAVKTDEC